VLAECPLVALDHQTAAITNRYRTTPAPFGRALTNQFPPRWINPSALLVASQSRSSGDETRFHAAEQQGLSPEVLGVEGGRGHRRSATAIHGGAGGVLALPVEVHGFGELLHNSMP
jgi:hypothetical protein